MAHHSVRFPLDISLGARGGPQRSTDIVTLGSGREERNQRWFASRRTFDARYGVKSRADMQAVLEFFEERRGRFHSFLWCDSLDYSTAKSGAVSALDQIIGQGDGETVTFQLFKTYGASFDPYERVIAKPIASSARIGVNGVEFDGANYALDVETGMVTFLGAPPMGQTISAGFEFHVPVRFNTDRMDVELSSFDAADIPTIPVIEVLS